MRSAFTPHPVPPPPPPAPPVAAAEATRRYLKGVVLRAVGEWDRTFHARCPHGRDATWAANPSVGEPLADPRCTCPEEAP